MSSDTRRPLAEARAIAESLIDLLRPQAEEISIAGSIRRGKADVGDVEIVALPRPGLLSLMDDLLKQGVYHQADYGGVKRWGDKHRGMLYKGIKCEIFIYDEHNRGFVQWLRTGPSDKNMLVMTQLAKDKAPYRFQEGYCWQGKHWRKNSRDKWEADEMRLIPVPDEATMYKLLGMPLLEPSQRTSERYMAQFGKSLHLWGSVEVCELYTSRIDSDDPDALDITIKSASTPEGRVLAPSWDMVMSYEAGTIDDNTYTAHYLNMLRARYKENPQPFVDILKRRRVVLTCDCSSEIGTFCHRHLAVEVLKKIASAKGLLVYNGCELQPMPKQIEMF